MKNTGSVICCSINIGGDGGASRIAFFFDAVLFSWMFPYALSMDFIWNHTIAYLFIIVATMSILFSGIPVMVTLGMKSINKDDNYHIWRMVFCRILVLVGLFYLVLYFMRDILSIVVTGYWVALLSIPPMVSGLLGMCYQLSFDPRCASTLIN